MISIQTTLELHKVAFQNARFLIVTGLTKLYSVVLETYFIPLLASQLIFAWQSDPHESIGIMDSFHSTCTHSIPACSCPCSSFFTQYSLPIVAFSILVSAWSGGVQTTSIQFGVDQFSQGASSDKLSSYFYWYVYDFGFQAETLTGILTLLGLFYVQLVIQLLLKFTCLPPAVVYASSHIDLCC